MKIAVAHIDNQSPIGSTHANLFRALSVCRACTPRMPVVDLPMKSSPKTKKMPNGTIAPVIEKNITSAYIFLFSILFIFLKNNRIAALNPSSIPMK
jgi:hypothetical protein